MVKKDTVASYVSYERLWGLLEKRKMSSRDLRESANISVRSIAKLEGDEVVRPAVLSKICAALKCEIDDIFERVATPPKRRKPSKAISPKRPHVVQPEFEVTCHDDCPVRADFSFIDLFAGIGGIRLGFESVGGHCVFSSEWDKNAAKTYEANFGERPNGDITKIDPKSIPDFDVLLGGFPCQPFSIIGDKEGFNHETQGTLFFNIEKILLAKKPKAFMLENVRNLCAHD